MYEKNQMFETNINAKADNRKQAFLYLDHISVITSLRLNFTESPR